MTVDCVKILGFILKFVIYFQISGSIANTGHSVIFTADNDTSIYSSYGNSNNGGMQINNQIPVNLTGKFYFSLFFFFNIMNKLINFGYIAGGPLSYRYRFHEMHIHYGLHDQFGSEHSVEGYTFPAEVRPFFFKARINIV